MYKNTKRKKDLEGKLRKCYNFNKKQHLYLQYKTCVTDRQSEGKRYHRALFAGLN